MSFTDEKINFDIKQSLIRNNRYQYIDPFITALKSDDFQKTIRVHPLADNYHIDFCKKWPVLAMLWWRYHHRIGWPEEYFFEHVKNGEIAIIKQLLLPADSNTILLFKSLIPFTITELTEELITDVARSREHVGVLTELNLTSISLHDIAVIYCTPVVTMDSIQYLLKISKEKALTIILRWIQLLNEDETDNFVNVETWNLKQPHINKLLERKEPEINMVSLESFSISVDCDLHSRHLDNLFYCLSMFLCGSTINRIRITAPSLDTCNCNYIDSKLTKYFKRNMLLEITFTEEPSGTNKLTIALESMINYI